MTHKELLKIATDFRDGMIGNGPSDSMCFVVSAPLQCFLSMVYGYETEMIEARITVESYMGVIECHHWFLRLPDGCILDPTADQFQTPEGGKMPNVYIGELPAWYFPKEELSAEYVNRWQEMKQVK